MRDLISAEAELDDEEDESFDEETGEERRRKKGPHFEDSSEEEEDDDDEEEARKVRECRFSLPFSLTNTASARFEKGSSLTKTRKKRTREMEENQEAKNDPS